MIRRPLVVPLLLALASVGCSGSDPTTDADDSTPATSAAPTITSTTEVQPAETSTLPSTSTTAAPVTTLAPTGSAQSCEGFITFVDDDGDGWGECVVTMETAQQQYFVISGKANGAIADLDANRQADCDVYLAATQTFIDELRAAVWPPEVQPQLDELIAANEFILFLRDDTCSYASVEEGEAASLRHSTAVFEWRTAIGSPTDF